MLRKSWVRRGIVILSMALIVFGLPVLTNAVSVQPGAAMVRAAFELGPAVTPGAGYASARKSVRTTRNIRIEVAGAPDALIDIYSPRNPVSPRLPIILWVHGGGFVSGSKSQVGPYAVMLASAGYVVASLDYSLAPEWKYPTPIRQGSAALAYLAGSAGRWGGDADRIFIGGDSAGAQIASELAAVQTNPRLASELGLRRVVDAGDLRGVILFCGLYDMSTVGRTGFPALRTFLWSYTGYRNWTDFPGIGELSTTKQVTADYPATFLSVGDSDPFEPQAFELARVLRAHDVPLTTEFWKGSGKHLGHEYQFDFAIPEANAALEKTLDFLADRSAS